VLAMMKETDLYDILERKWIRFLPNCPNEAALVSAVVLQNYS
jgi:hypothetical protein